MDKSDVILEHIKSLDNSNSGAHEEMKDRLDNLNGSVAKIKTKQLVIGTALVTCMVVLVAIGRLPDGILKLVKAVLKIFT